MKDGRRRAPIMTIAVAIFIMTTIALWFLHLFSSDDDNQSTDDETSPPASAAATAEPTPPLKSEEPDDLGTPPPPATIERDTISMDISDIHKGNLVFINKDNSYDVPGDIDVVLIDEAKTAPYTVINILDSIVNENLKVLRSIISPLDKMMQGFIDETGENIIAVISAFRDHDMQQRMLDLNTSLYGREEALRQTSLPGYSEHHTGLAIDFVGVIDGQRKSFRDLPITLWYSENSYRYGFILSYPEDKTDITGSIYEPWHFRYVGIPHSYVMYRDNLVLGEYIDMIRAYTVDNPLNVEYDGANYQVYFAQGTNITIPKDAQYEISGNNIDGFIVTITM